MSRNFILLGAGDLAREILSLLKREIQDFKAVCYIDADQSGRPGIQAEVLSGGLEKVQKTHPPKDWEVLTCLMQTSARARLYNAFKKMDYRFGNLVASDSTLESPSTADGLIVFPGARLAYQCKVGSNTLVYYNAVVGHDAKLGDHSFVCPGAIVGGRVEGSERVIYGMNSTVMPGRKVGAGAIIAAGSSAWAHVPAETTVAGVPARPLPLPGKR